MGLTCRRYGEMRN